MRVYFTIFSFLFAFALIAQESQIHIMSLGEGYGKQSFLNLKTGEEFQLNNDAWDIAFSNVGQTDAGIFINESSSNSVPALALFLAPTTDWNEPITDVSVFVDSLILYNQEANWTQGAFNHVATGGGLDLGWGAYNVQTHVIEGNKVFVIKGRDGSFKKIFIENLQGGTYNFKYANLDGSDEQTKSVAKGTDKGATIFFSLKSGEVVPTPKDYDLMFWRYYTVLDDDGDPLDYIVTGILTAPGVESVKVVGVDPENIDENDYKDEYTSFPKNIGHDWKDINLSTFSWVIRDDQVNFVKTKDNDIYKIVFIDFEGSSTGSAFFVSTFLKNTTSSKDVEAPISVSVFPNPAHSSITIEADAVKDIKIDMFAVTGQLIKSAEAQTNQPIDISNLNYKGLVSLRIVMDNKVVVKQLTVN